jgi:hypothetical protein
VTIACHEWVRAGEPRAGLCSPWGGAQARSGPRDEERCGWQRPTDCLEGDHRIQQRAAAPPVAFGNEQSGPAQANHPVPENGVNSSLILHHRLGEVGWTSFLSIRKSRAVRRSSSWAGESEKSRRSPFAGGASAAPSAPPQSRSPWYGLPRPPPRRPAGRTYSGRCTPRSAHRRSPGWRWHRQRPASSPR